MESKNKGLTELLNSLIQINYDRSEGYTKARNQISGKHLEMGALFSELAGQSLGFANVLGEKVARLKGEAATGTTVSGKIHRVLMGMKWTFTGTEKLPVVSSCIRGEEMAMKAYDTALASDVEMSSETRQMLFGQKQCIQQSLERLRMEKNETLPILV